MKETLISFETAKLAKEKDFKDHCEYSYYEITADCYYDDVRNHEEYLAHSKGEIILTSRPASQWHYNDFKAPTQSLLQKWLRDKYNIDISIHRSFSMNKSYHYTILINCDYDNIIQQICEPNRNYETSLELALQDALKNIKN